MQAKLLSFKSFNTNSAGEPLIGQWGPYCKLSAKFDIEGYQDKFASCIVKPENPANGWQSGQFVEIESIGMKNGYPVFTLPKKSITSPTGQVSQSGAQLLEKLFTKMNEMDAKIDTIKTLTQNLEVAESKVNEQVTGIDPADIPF